VTGPVTWDDVVFCMVELWCGELKTEQRGYRSDACLWTMYADSFERDAGDKV